MSLVPGGITVAVPSQTVMSNRTGNVQVISTNTAPIGQSLIQHSAPVIRQDAVIRTQGPITPGTAVRFIRKPTSITVLNPGNSFVTSPVQPFSAYGTSVVPINHNVMQSLSSASGLVSSGMTSVGGTGGVANSTLSNLANSRKPCNCTKSHCLKLYCECFAQGQLCQNCNCNHCMNNLAYEEERGRAIKMTLERNPTAFHPKIGRGEGERKHTKGCNCKRSGCLKNYCECYEAKISCSDLCRCQGCRNTEDSVERRSLLRLAAMGSLRCRQPLSLKKHLVKPHPDTLPHVFFTWEVVEATAGCLLAQAEEAERRDLPPATQERVILEEFGRILEHVIDSASKAQIRSSLVPPDGEAEASVLPGAGGLPVYSHRTSDAVGHATAAAVAADVLLRDDEDDDDDDEIMQTIGVIDDTEPGAEDPFEEDMGASARRHFSKHSRRSGAVRQRSARSRATEVDSEPESDEDSRAKLKHRHSSRNKLRNAESLYHTRRAAVGRAHDPDDVI